MQRVSNPMDAEERHHKTRNMSPWTSLMHRVTNTIDVKLEIAKLSCVVKFLQLCLMLQRAKNTIEAKLETATLSCIVKFVLLCVMLEVTVLSLILFYLDNGVDLVHLKLGCQGTGKTYLREDDVIYDITGLGCVIRKPIDDNHMFYCRRADGVTGTRKVTALSVPPAEMILNDDTPHAIAFASPGSAFGWLAIDSGVECEIDRLDSSNLYVGLDIRLLFKINGLTCEALNITDYEFSRNSNVTCEMDTSSGVPVPHFHIHGPRQFPHKLKNINSRDPKCLDDFRQAANLKSNGNRSYMVFKFNSCSVPPTERANNSVGFSDPSLYISRKTEL